MPLKVINLSKQFARSWAFRDVSFEVGDGEIFGIAGDSSDTRTLILKAVAGIEKVSGSVLIDGHAIDAKYALGRDISLFPVPQNSFYQRVFGRGPTDDRFNLEDISRAAFNGCRVLLFDNPFYSMEMAEKETAFESLRALVNENRLSVLAANLPYRDTLELCDSVAILDRGEIVAAGTPGGVYLEPACIAAAIATGRHNLFEARRISSSTAEMPEFQTIEGSHRLRTKAVKKSGLGAINRNLTLGIRPEHVSLSFGASFPEDNIVRAVVIGVNFLGDTTLVKLDAAGLHISSLVMRLVGLNVGDECMIALPPDRIQIFTN